MHWTHSVLAVLIGRCPNVIHHNEDFSVYIFLRDYHIGYKCCVQLARQGEHECTQCITPCSILLLPHTHTITEILRAPQHSRCSPKMSSEVFWYSCSKERSALLPSYLVGSLPHCLCPSAVIAQAIVLPCKNALTKWRPPKYWGTRNSRGTTSLERKNSRQPRRSTGMD